jgi:dihydroxy-acid dehydratase
MKMHSSKFRDPLITRAQPVTVLVPVIEEALRLACVQPHRDPIIDRFMNGAPRVAVVHGSEDHPPALGSKEMSRRLVRFIWASGGLPFEVAQSFPCEELSHATDGAHYALLSRNFCAANMASHMEEHGYDGAIVIGVCDKMMVGNLRALIETDLARQRRRARPIFAMVIPPAIGREVFVSEEDRRRFEPLKARLHEDERAQLDELLHRSMKPNVYAQIKSLLDRCFNRRLIQEAEKDELEYCLVRCTSVIGSNCAASEASMINRMMLASFGLVPRHLDVLVKPPADDQLSDMVKRLFTAILKRERRMSVASLVRSNLGNASAVWSATGGHPGWLLHLSYLANAIGKKLEMEDIMKKVKAVPQVLAINERSGNSAYLMGVETENGGNSGIDTIMRTLSEKRLIEDRAGTFDGSWMQRIMDARSANGNFLFSTMTPYAQSCGMVGVHGNLCAAGVARISASKGDFSRFDGKIYLAICYLGIKELLLDLESSAGVLEKLKRRVDRDDLYYTWLFNRAAASPSSNGTQVESWNKNRLWDYLIGEDLLRVMIVVAGAGPRAAGMPEIRLSSAAQPNLAAMTVLVTDGRVSFQHAGISISHLVPEAMDGGALGAVRTGDWIYMDVGRGELQLVSGNRTHDGYKVMPVKELLNRPDLKKRVHELERRRLDLLPSFRVLLDQISSAQSGVSPASK